MKKIVLFLIFVFSAFSVFAQEPESRIQELQNYFKEFQIDPIVHYNPDEEIILFVDANSETPDDVLYQISFMLTAFSFFLDDEDIELDDVEVETIVYRWIIIMNESKPIDDPDQMPVDITVDEDWLDDFFDSRRNARNTMILEAMSEAVDRLEEQLEQQGASLPSTR